MYDGDNDEDKILFNIVGDTGAIYLKDKPAQSTYEEWSSRVFTLSVSATDSEGVSKSRIIVINVVDVDEAPKFAAC